MVDGFLNSKQLNPGLAVPYIGAAVIGKITAMEIARAQVDETDPMLPVEGVVTPVWPEIVDWPWAADSAGIPFDQANLYGVRKACYRRPLADGGGDHYQGLVAVPKALPVGYVEGHRKDFDFDPYYALRRTANDYTYASVSTQNGWGVYGTDQEYDGATVYPGTPYQLPGSGAGFRGTSWSITVSSPLPGVPVTATAQILADATVVATFSASSNPDGTSKTTTGTTGPLLAPTLGTLINFYATIDVGTLTILLGRRVDIPLFCNVSYHNKVAPGGYVA